MICEFFNEITLRCEAARRVEISFVFDHTLLTLYIALLFYFMVCGGADSNKYATLNSHLAEFKCN